jgi:hypothetical protein
MLLGVVYAIHRFFFEASHLFMHEHTPNLHTDNTTTDRRSCVPLKITRTNHGSNAGGGRSTKHAQPTEPRLVRVCHTLLDIAWSDRQLWREMLLLANTSEREYAASSIQFSANLCQI